MTDQRLRTNRVARASGLSALATVRRPRKQMAVRPQTSPIRCALDLL